MNQKYNTDHLNQESSPFSKYTLTFIKHFSISNKYVISPAFLQIILETKKLALQDTNI